MALFASFIAGTIIVPLFWPILAFGFRPFQCLPTSTASEHILIRFLRKLIPLEQCGYLQCHLLSLKSNMTKWKLTHRCREQTSDYERGWDKVRTKWGRGLKAQTTRRVIL